MKKPSFAALLYRDFLLMKSSLLACGIGALIFILFPVLILLSFRFGNLRLIIPQDAISGSMNIIKLIPLMAVSMFAMLPTDTTAKDITNPIWDRFRRSTQVSAARLALCKTVMQIICIAVPLIISIPLTYIIAYSTGTTVSGTDIGLSILCIAFLSFMSGVFSAAIYFFKSVDKGALVLTGIMIAFVFSFMIPIAGKLSSLPPSGPQRSAVIAAYLNDVISNIAPFAPLLLIGVVLLQFVLLLFIFKRREK